MENLQHEFDWSVVVILISMIIGGVITHFGRLLLKREQDGESKGELKTRVDNLEKEYKGLKEEMHAEHRRLEDKIDRKDEHIAGLIRGMEMKFDKRFNEIQTQIIEILKSIKIP